MLIQRVHLQMLPKAAQKEVPKCITVSTQVSLSCNNPMHKDTMHMMQSLAPSVDRVLEVVLL